MFKSRRFYSNLVIFGLFLFMPSCPWYVPLALAAFCAWHVFFFEIIILGFLMDLQFESGHFVTVLGHAFPLAFTVLASFILVVLQTIKNKVRFYP